MIQLCLHHCASSPETRCAHCARIIALWVSEPNTQLQTQSKLMFRDVLIDSRLGNTTFRVQRFQQRQSLQTSLRRPAYRVLLAKNSVCLPGPMTGMLARIGSHFPLQQHSHQSCSTLSISHAAHFMDQKHPFKTTWHKY